MNKMIKDNKESLELEYAFLSVWYKLSFKDRILIKLKRKTYPNISVNSDIKKMNIDELNQAIKEIKKPWWNFVISLI